MPYALPVKQTTPAPWSLFPPLALETTTDARGAFALDHVPAAGYTIRFEHSGYRATGVAVGVGSQQTTVVSEVILQPE
ncbi:MAG: carboxypeptidase regulatory-like domain-containing protein [Nitrospirae bacterium]|nr:carboxypeptidase regulatory-like domain-containing protein [Nitrospirota bacterium]